MGDEVAQLESFLSDARADVRMMAAEGVAGYTATAEGTAALTKRGTTLYPELVSLVARAPTPECAGAAAMACAALVNLSQQPRERLKLLDDAGKGLIRAAAAAVAVDEPPELAEYSSMLLANLTQLATGVEQLLAADGEMDAFRKTLLPRLASAPLADVSGVRWSHVALVLTNVAQLVNGRAALLGVLAEDASSTLLGSLCGQLAASAGGSDGGADDPRRRATARFLRNLCFAASPKEEEAPARTHLLAVHRKLVLAITARLAVRHGQYRDDEKTAFHADLVSAVGAEMVSGPDYGPWSGHTMPEGEEPQAREHTESDPEVRLALTEALLLMSASPEARATMRELGIYPILRDAHLTEDPEKAPASRHVRDANEQLVDLFYLSQEAVGTMEDAEKQSAEIEEVPD